MVVNWTNVTQPQHLLALPNVNTGGNFWLGMLFMMWFILIAMFVSYGIEIAILGASFIALIIGILLAYMGLMAWTYCLIFAGVIIFTMLYIMWAKKSDY